MRLLAWALGGAAVIAASHILTGGGDAAAFFLIGAAVAEMTSLYREIDGLQIRATSAEYRLGILERDRDA